MKNKYKIKKLNGLTKQSHTAILHFPKMCSWIHAYLLIEITDDVEKREVGIHKSILKIFPL